MNQISINELKEIITSWALESGYKFNVYKFNPRQMDSPIDKGGIYLALEFLEYLNVSDIDVEMSEHELEWSNLLAQEIGAPVYLNAYVGNTSQKLKQDIIDSGIPLFAYSDHKNP